MKKKKLLSLFTLILFFLTVVVCNVAFAGKEEAEEAGVEPIRIGIPVPLTGSMAADGIEMQRGAEIAIKQINESGGINGQPVEMIPFDSKELLAETFQAAAEKLILRENVVALISGYAGEAGPDTFGKYDVPFIYHEPSHYCMTLHETPGYDNVFMNGCHSREVGPVLFSAVVNFAEAGGHEFPDKTFAVVMGQWTAIQEQATGMAEKGEAMGWTKVLEQVAPEGTREWSGTMAKLRAKKPSLIIFNLWDYPAIMLFKKEFMKDPWNTLIYWGEGTSIPDFRDGLVADQNGEMGMSFMGVIPGRKMTEMLVNDYQAMYDKDMPERPVTDSYDGVWIWANAARQVDDVRDFKAVSEAIKNSAWEGAGGTYIFDENNHVSYKNQPAHLYQVQNGKLVTVALNDNVIEGVKFVTPAWIK